MSCIFIGLQIQYLITPMSPTRVHFHGDIPPLACFDPLPFPFPSPPLSYFLSPALQLARLSPSFLNHAHVRKEGSGDYGESTRSWVSLCGSLKDATGTGIGVLKEENQTRQDTVNDCHCLSAQISTARQRLPAQTLTDRKAHTCKC
jgi:hypothetical protein